MLVDLEVPAGMSDELVELAVVAEAQRVRWATLDGAPGVTSGDAHAVVVGADLATVRAAFGLAAQAVPRD